MSFTLDQGNCLIKGNKGICTQQQVTRQLFPGDSCIKSEECQFGSKECKQVPGSTIMQCSYLDSTTKCQSSSDCEPGLYCDKDGGSNACTSTYNTGSSCGDDEVCGGDSLCHYDHFNGNNGKCIKYLSLEEGSYIGIELKIKGSIIQSNVKVNCLGVAETENLICKSGFVDSKGRCAIPKRKAANKGKYCNSDYDCSTNTGEPGNCVSSFINNKKYCGPLEGDDEWQDALRAVFVGGKVV